MNASPHGERGVAVWRSAVEARCATLPLCASCERKTERLPYYLRAPLPTRPAYVDYEDTAFTFDHPALKRSCVARVFTMF